MCRQLPAIKIDADGVIDPDKLFYIATNTSNRNMSTSTARIYNKQESLGFSNVLLTRIQKNLEWAGWKNSSDDEQKKKELFWLTVSVIYIYSLK